MLGEIGATVLQEQSVLVRVNTRARAPISVCAGGEMERRVFAGDFRGRK